MVLEGKQLVVQVSVPHVPPVISTRSNRYWTRMIESLHYCFNGTSPNPS